MIAVSQQRTLESDVTVYFSNPGLIDLDVIRVMGVSVKENENPIGYFGTGLKFALATLLRTGHQITLKRGHETYRFTARETDIRGQKFQRCFMNDEPLPFTTALGKNWQVWQAYRELHSNTLDEFGTITDSRVSGDTVITVTGDAIQREFINRDKIFVSGKPIAATSALEVYEGRSRTVFYRGVRAGNMPEELSFTYNILTDMALTEDRTFESQFDVEWKLAQLIPMIDHKGVISELLEGTDRWDQNLNFANCSSPSEEFVDVAASRYSDMNAPASAKRVVDRDMQKRGDFKPASLSDAEAQKFLDAFAHLAPLGCTLSPEDVEVVETLGPNIMGIHHKERDCIFLAKSTLDWGMETVVATLYEEWLHKEYHYRDKTRELQNFLFQRLVALSMGNEGPEPERQKAGWMF